MKRTLTSLPVALCAALALTFLACSDDGDDDDEGGSGSGSYGSYTGKGNDISKYKTVDIGDQTWMAENMNDESAGICYGDGDSKFTKAQVQDNCDKYGRLYNWEDAMDICPSGWHLPTNDEWDALMEFVDSESGTDYTAGKYLKAKSGWDDDYINGGSGNGEDTYGFAALPGGDNPGSNFTGIGINGNWWTATNDTNFARVRSMVSYSNYVGENRGTKTAFNSVRCIKD